MMMASRRAKATFALRRGALGNPVSPDLQSEGLLVTRENHIRCLIFRSHLPIGAFARLRILYDVNKKIR